jgi:hypothetical protein
MVQSENSIYIKNIQLENEIMNLQNEIINLQNENEILKKYHLSKIRHSRIYCDMLQDKNSDQIQNENITRYNSFKKFFCIWKC